MNQQYKIGDVSKILGISPDLLRYYEKKGVVHPVKGKNNDYRYYESWDINFLLDCLWFKQFGFGIEQIAHLVSDCSIPELNGIMDGKLAEIRASIHRQQLLLRRAERYCLDLEHATEFLGKCDICWSPETVRYLNRYNFLYENNAGCQQITGEWLQYMPFVHRCFEIEKGTLAQQGEEYAWGFSLDMEYVREFDVEIKAPAIHLESKKCLHSVFQSVGKDQFSPKRMAYMMDYCREHNLEVTGNAYGNLLCSVLEDGQLGGYFEVWLPIA